MCPKSFGRKAAGKRQVCTRRHNGLPAGKRLHALRAPGRQAPAGITGSLYCRTEGLIINFSPTLCVCMYGDGEHTICGQIFYLISQTKTKLKQKRLQFLFCSLLYLVCKLNARGYPPKRFLPDNQFSDRAGARLPAGAYLLVRNFYIKDALSTCLN